ncbi:hypothetical protein SCG7086_AK_00160 [Chlamydiales bacterium SCGC AG-110-P3]|nr:hypothetical protein SCG7086_AK_00160 [Chlamydiales bacterium SCGC AG-110-P3]
MISEKDKSTFSLDEKDLIKQLDDAEKEVEKLYKATWLNSGATGQSVDGFMSRIGKLRAELQPEVGVESESESEGKIGNPLTKLFRKVFPKKQSSDFLPDASHHIHQDLSQLSKTEDSKPPSVEKEQGEGSRSKNLFKGGGSAKGCEKAAWFRKQSFWVTALTDKRDPAPVWIFL